MQGVEFSVSKIAEYIKSIFDAEELLTNINMYGEISGVNVSGGNTYFTIKDEFSAMQCIVFGTHFKDIVTNGSNVLLTGSPNYHTKTGKLSFIARAVKPYGIGELYAKYLELKAKLEKEGLFDAKRKIRIPKFVKKIGVVTSPTGAVIQDIINVAHRRNDSVDIALFPVRVQGVGAEIEIAEGIRYFDEESDIDVILVARGGGSFEDLQPFNTEIVARSVANCRLPIVSCVGHETDFTLVDFVSDLRAPTPSAAAELVVFDKRSEIFSIDRIVERTARSLSNRIENYEKLIDTKLKDLLGCLRIIFNKSKYKVDSLSEKLITNYNYYLDARFLKLNTLESKLTVLDPKVFIEKGYVKLTGNGGQKIKSIKDVEIDDELSLYLLDGKIKSKVMSKENSL